MRTTEVSDGVFRLSANVDNILFEGMWPVPKGVAMNSYLVKGEKAAIIDGVCTWDGVPETLFEQLNRMDVQLEEIEYVIINHMEPDHSGWLEPFAKLRGDKSFHIYCTGRAVPLLEHFYRLTDNVHPVKSGDTLDLGGGRVLEFYEIPNVHWPETMVTFDRSTGTLFSCDAFGSFGSVQTDAPYDDQLSQEQIDFFEQEAERYYSNIVAVFSGAVQKAIEKLAGLPVQIVAPGHGIVWRQRPEKIITDYVRYAGYANGPAKPEIAVLWGSMYGMTEQAVQPLVEAIEAEGVKAKVCRVPETPLSYVLHAVWASSAVAIGMPTYEYKMFPPMAQVLDEVGKKRIINRKAFRFGSFGWYGGAEKELHEINERLKMKWDFLPSVEFQGAPTDAHIEQIRARGCELAQAVLAAAATPA